MEQVGRHELNSCLLPPCFLRCPAAPSGLLMMDHRSAVVRRRSRETAAGICFLTHTTVIDVDKQRCNFSPFLQAAAHTHTYTHIHIHTHTQTHTHTHTHTHTG